MPAIATRERRLGLQLSLDVNGEDASGVPFTLAARTRNISGGGLCFESPRRLMVGTRLSLHIQIPPPLRRRFGGKAVYRVRAVVCRLERFEGGSMMRVGARFLGDLEA
jgi:hypothetical protein